MPIFEALLAGKAWADIGINARIITQQRLCAWQRMSAARTVIVEEVTHSRNRAGGVVVMLGYVLSADIGQRSIVAVCCAF